MSRKTGCRVLQRNKIHCHWSFPSARKFQTRNELAIFQLLIYNSCLVITVNFFRIPINSSQILVCMENVKTNFENICAYVTRDIKERIVVTVNILLSSIFIRF